MGTIHHLLSRINAHRTVAGIHTTQPDKEAILDTALKHNQALVGNLEAELDTRDEILNRTAMVTITDLHGTIIYANDLFCQTTGYPRHHAIGHTHNIIRHPDLPETTVKSIWRTIRKGGSWRGEIRSRRKDGGYFWSQTTVAPVLNGEGLPARYVWVRYDITDLKNTEIRLREARQRADQQLLDNVQYATSIQQGLLPAETELQAHFPASFVLFRPKHAVSGDFYWFTRVEEETVVVLGDGTGHGVSASFVSLMALTGLKYAVEDMRLTDPGVVLSQLNSFLYRAMNKHKGSNLRESVDMSFCRYNHTTRMLTYASGKSRIFLVRDGQLHELGQDYPSIGSIGGTHSRIAARNMLLEHGDRIFMLSDGLPDQLGGDKEKRFGTRHVKELLLLTAQAPIDVQKEAIYKNYLLWRGTNEATDDLSLIAFEID